MTKLELEDKFSKGTAKRVEEILLILNQDFCTVDSYQVLELAFLVDEIRID